MKGRWKNLDLPEVIDYMRAVLAPNILIQNRRDFAAVLIRRARREDIRNAYEYIKRPSLDPVPTNNYGRALREILTTTN